MVIRSVPAEIGACLVADLPERAECGILKLQFAADEAEIHWIEVAETVRRRGVASALIQAGMALARQRGATWLYLEVRESNHAARAFYRRLNFEPCGLRPGYYQNPAEAAVLMRRCLGPEPASHP